jgi:hypothetical protein
MNTKQIEQALKALAKAGLIKDTGTRRNGQIVWAVTDKLEKLETLREALRDNSEQLDRMVGELDRLALFEKDPTVATLRRWADTLYSIPELLREAFAVTDTALNDALAVLARDDNARRH